MNMLHLPKMVLPAIISFLSVISLTQLTLPSAAAQETLATGSATSKRTPGTARITEEIRSLETYPFSEPNPVPMLAKDARLYPYHSFEGYSHESEPHDWKVIKLENDYIEVYVLPEVGGKIWGAIEKKTGHEFIYRNEVMKFRNIALRGPWTSGGIEFNFGVIGHTPSTATPVDYLLRENDDGSVSAFVGAMDLPSRTTWRVEIRLPAEASYFETRVYWNNPTSLVQPYYNWMTAAAFARDDLTMSIPGNRYLTHPGEARDWPTDKQGRYLPDYTNNAFEGHKSYHVVGEYNDYFGGYYTKDDYGFGHWARFEDMPGQKLWLWALSRQGGVWEDLLTDTDGQYVEYQAGRMLVQYSPGDPVNPITKAGFEPLTTDRWSERWFPVLGTGGISDVSDKGVMFVDLTDDGLRIRVNVFESTTGTVEIWGNHELKKTVEFALEPLETWETVFEGWTEIPRLKIEALDLRTALPPEPLERPFTIDPAARKAATTVDSQIFEGRELMKARYYADARELFESALDAEPWNRNALIELAALDLRENRLVKGLELIRKALQLNAHDADANFVAGALYQASHVPGNALDNYSWAARSMKYRSSANARMAEVKLFSSRPEDALEFARRSLDYDRYNISALEVIAVARRNTGDDLEFRKTIDRIKEIDPLNHFARAEEYLMLPGKKTWGAFISGLNNEFPDQTVLELALRYETLGKKWDGSRLLEAWGSRTSDPLLILWRAYLNTDEELLAEAATVNDGIAAPYRPEMLPALLWASRNDDHWTWAYLYGLNLWALNWRAEALSVWDDLNTRPDKAAFYVARASLAAIVQDRDQERDLLRAVLRRDASRLTEIYLIRYYQSNGKWREALGRSAGAMNTYQGDFNLELMHARSLLFLSRPEEAVAILESTRVLPSENSRESHHLFESAHLMYAIELIESCGFAGESCDHTVAREHADRARAWPEHLGQGRPYEPDEYLIEYVVTLIDAHQGISGARETLRSLDAELTERFDSGPDEKGRPPSLSDLIIDQARQITPK